MATTVAARSFRRVYGTELAGGAGWFGDPLADPAVEALAGPLRSARGGADHVSSPRNQLAPSCVGNKGETQLKRALTQGVGIVSNLSRSERGGGLACSRCGNAMDEVVRIAPLPPKEPGLIAYECPGCGYVTSVLSHPDGEQ